MQDHDPRQFWLPFEIKNPPGEFLAALLIWLAVLWWSAHALGSAFHMGATAALVLLAASCAALLLAVSATVQSVRAAGKPAAWLAGGRDLRLPRFTAAAGASAAEAPAAAARPRNFPPQLL